MYRKKRYIRKRKKLLIRLASVLLPAAFLVVMLSQTAFARSYAVTDGDAVRSAESTVGDPALPGEGSGAAEGESAAAAGRAGVLKLRYHGQNMEVSVFDETVEALLNRLGLGTEEGDMLSHSPDTVVYGGMELCVDSVLCRRETYTAALHHETTYCRDASIPEGMEEVLIEGVDGEVLRTASVTYINGQEVQRELLSETVTIAPVTRIVAVGTGDVPQAQAPDAMPVIADGYILLPTGEVLTYTDTATIRATAYTHTDAGCDLITSTGSVVHWGTVAVDPRYIPYGTRMFIVASDGSYIYGIAEAEDCGGDIKGDRMDLYMPTYAQCIEFGRRVCTIYFLGEE